jgi:hypothetical protein
VKTIWTIGDVKKKKTVITGAVGRGYHSELEDNSDDERKMRLFLRKGGTNKR